MQIKGLVEVVQDQEQYLNYDGDTAGQECALDARGENKLRNKLSKGFKEDINILGIEECQVFDFVYDDW